jgi:phage shock protein C
MEGTRVMAMGSRRFYLDKDRAKLAGVCAGIADYFGWDVTLVRIAWVIATLVWSPVMIITYILMAWLVDPKPYALSSAGMGASAGMGPCAPTRFSDVRERFDRLEGRLRSLERVVTSREFQMDRELKGMGRP